MKSTPLLRQLFAVVLTTTFISLACRKNDWRLQVDNQDKQNEALFFNAHSPNSPAAQAVLWFTKNQNAQYHFAAHYLEQIGKPRWDKALVFESKNAATAADAAVDSTVVYIPFVRDADHYVNASLIVNMKPGDTTFRMLYDWQYKNFGFEHPKGSGWNASSMMQMYMQMDRQVFGTGQYLVKDAQLLPSSTTDYIKANQWPLDSIEVIASLTTDMSRQPVEASAMIQSYCVTTIYCVQSPKEVKAFRGAVQPMSTSGDGSCTSNTQCYISYPDFGGGGGGTGNPGGSGGGGSGGGSGSGSGAGWTDPNPAPVDCTTKASYAIGKDNPCPRGWEPVVDKNTVVLEEQELGDAKFQGILTYVSPSGVVINLPEGSKLNLYLNIDTDILPNGALYSFILPNKDKYIALQKSYAASNAMAVSGPEFEGYYKIENDTVNYKSPLPSGIIIPEPKVNVPVKAVRMNINKKANGQCELIREIVEVIQKPGSNGSAPPLISASANYEIKHSPLATGYTSEKRDLTECPGQVSPSNSLITLDQFAQQQGAKVAQFFKDRLQSDVKVYLYDCATNKAKHVISKNGVAAVPSLQQSAQLQKFNNNQFSATDEEIAIKGCIQNGEWKYEAKFNYTRLGNLPPKVSEAFNALVAEINHQANEAVKQIKGVGRSTAAISIAGDEGEMFFKDAMGFFETIGALYDVGKHVLKQGTLPEFLWDQGRRTSSSDAAVATKYQKSPLKLPAILCGGADQLIEEITGIVQLVKTGYEAMRNPKEAYDNVYSAIRGLNKEKIKQFISSATGYANYQAGGDRARYQGGRHGVQAAMIFSAGLKLFTKGADVVKKSGEEIGGIQKFVPDGSTNHAAANALKNAADNKKAVKNIDGDKLVMQNIENGQNVVVAVEKKGSNVDVYKYRKEDYKRPDGSIPDDVLLEQYVQQDLTEKLMPAHSTRPANYPDAGVPGAHTSYHPQGRKNIGWNKELNELPLKANHKYVTKNATYHTDTKGRVIKVEMNKLEKDPNFNYEEFRNGHQQTKSVTGKGGTVGTDQGGHLLGNQFGGPGEQINLVPMKKSLNQHPGTWAQMEQEWVNTLNVNGTVTDIEINIIYGANGRPTGFQVYADINGVTKPYNHTN